MIVPPPGMSYVIKFATLCFFCQLKSMSCFTTKSIERTDNTVKAFVVVHLSWNISLTWFSCVRFPEVIPVQVHPSTSIPPSRPCVHHHWPYNPSTHPPFFSTLVQDESKCNAKHATLLFFLSFSRQSLSSKYSNLLHWCQKKKQDNLIIHLKKYFGN